MTTFDNRIGRINELEDRVDWPETDFMGKPYEKPASTHMLSSVTFVVLPKHVTPAILKALEEFKRSDAVAPISLAVVSEETKTKKG